MGLLSLFKRKPKPHVHEPMYEWQSTMSPDGILNSNRIVCDKCGEILRPSKTTTFKIIGIHGHTTMLTHKDGGGRRPAHEERPGKYFP